MVGTYLVERYVASTARDDLLPGLRRLRAAAARMRREGQQIRYVRSVLIPADQTWMHFVTAPDRESVERLVETAEMEADRISEALETWRTAADGPAPRDDEGSERMR